MGEGGLQGMENRDEEEVEEEKERIEVRVGGVVRGRVHLLTRR